MLILQIIQRREKKKVLSQYTPNLEQYILSYQALLTVLPVDLSNFLWSGTCFSVVVLFYSFALHRRPIMTLLKAKAISAWYSVGLCKDSKLVLHRVPWVPEKSNSCGEWCQCILFFSWAGRKAVLLVYVVLQDKFTVFWLKLSSLPQYSCSPQDMPNMTQKGSSFVLERLPQTGSQPSKTHTDVHTPIANLGTVNIVLTHLLAFSATPSEEEEDCSAGLMDSVSNMQIKCFESAEKLVTSPSKMST